MSNQPTASKKVLIDGIERQMSLFQSTVGNAQTNVISTITIILNGMGQTILAQYDRIVELEEAAKKQPKTKEVPVKE